MGPEEIVLLKFLGGVLAVVTSITVYICRVRIAKIQKDKDKVFDISFNPNGSVKQIIIKGFPVADVTTMTTKISHEKGIRNLPAKNTNGRAFVSKFVKKNH